MPERGRSRPVFNSPMFLPEYKTRFVDHGYVVVPSLFSPQEAAALKIHYRMLRESVTTEYWEPQETTRWAEFPAP